MAEVSILVLMQNLLNKRFGQFGPVHFSGFQRQHNAPDCYEFAFERPKSVFVQTDGLFWFKNQRSVPSGRFDFENSLSIESDDDDSVSIFCLDSRANLNSLSSRILTEFADKGFAVSHCALVHNYDAWRQDKKSGFVDEFNNYFLFTPCGHNSLLFNVERFDGSEYQKTYTF